MQKDLLKKINTVIPFLLGSTLVYAGDMGPVSTPSHNWTGFYFGANAGVLWGSYSAPVWIDTLLVGTSIIGPSEQFYDAQVSSFTGGAQLGYDYQFNNNCLMGVEFSFNGERLNSIHYLTAAELSATTRFIADDSYAATNNWHSAILARLGYAWNNLMFYGIGGVALANSNFSANFISHTDALDPTILYPDVSVNDNEVMVGGTIGLGLAYALASHLNLGVESRYTNYGSQKFNLATVPIYPTEPGLNNFYYQSAYAKLSFSSVEVMAKINYQFG